MAVTKSDAARVLKRCLVIVLLSRPPLPRDRHCFYMVIAVIELFIEEQLLSDRHYPATAIAFIIIISLLQLLIYYVPQSKHYFRPY